MPFIDSLMRQLNTTGFISRSSRNLLASYLSTDLQQDWRYGAYHFEETLIDYDVHLNYVSWNFSVGIGPGRILLLNQLEQSRKIDPNGDYIKAWCPEL